MSEEKTEQKQNQTKEIDLDKASAEEVKEFIQTLEKQRRSLILGVNVATSARSTINDALNAITLLEKQQGILSSVFQAKLSSKPKENDEGEQKEQ